MQEIISADELINSYTSNKTRQSYGYILKKYLKYIYPEENQGKYNETSTRYITELKEGRDFIKDLMNFAEDMREKCEPSTIKQTTAITQYWIEINDIKATKWKKKQLRNTIPKGEPEYEEGELTKEKLLEIYNMMNEKNKMFMLIMISAGSRLTETTKIRYEDINFENYPTTIKLRPETTKNGRGRTILISEEAEKAIIDYTRKNNITNGYLVENGTDKFRNNWYDVMKKSEEVVRVKRKNRYKTHIHMLRKWFLSQFKLNASSEIAELLAGHEGYLTKAYRRYPRETIAEEYKKAEKALSILSNNNLIPKYTGTMETAYYEC